MHRSFIDKNLMDSYLIDQINGLPKEIVFRFNNILRLKQDEKVALFDGEGRQIEGLWDKKTNNLLQIKQINQEKPSTTLTLLQACLEEAKLTETVKRATEFGVDQIIFFNAEYSQKFCWQKLLKKNHRLEQIAIDAARQSERFFVPKIIFEENLEKIPPMLAKTIGFFGLLSAKNLLSEATIDANLNELFIIVGPEGGLSPKEVDWCKKNNFIAVKWAPYVLRSELACLSALSIINGLLKRA